MVNNQKFLVILASYNGEKYLKQQLESILNQDVVDLDIMIFDDQSSDNTVNLVKEFCKNHKNVSLVINSRPSGSAAKNFCNSIKNLSEVIITKYDYVALSDQDDIWLSNKLLFAAEELSSRKASLYASNLILWEEKTNKKTLLKKDYSQKKFDFLFEGGSAGCTYVFTSDFAKHLKNKLFEIDYENWLYFSHDWLIYFIARLDKFKVFIDGKAEIFYRIHADNVHGQLNKNSFSAIFKRFQLVNNGWYYKQLDGFSQFFKNYSEENEIYNLYKKSWFSRVSLLLKYNFQLMRSKKKYVKFLLMSMLPNNSALKCNQ
jgi:rhamnosyltransferase